MILDNRILLVKGRATAANTSLVFHRLCLESTMEILGAIAGEIAKYTLKPIVRQVGYLFFYKDNFKELKNQVEKLGTAKERIVHEVEAERRNGREIEPDVEEWLNKANDTLEKAKRLCEDPRCVKAECSGWCLPNLISRHQLSRNAKKTVENVAEVLTHGKFDRIGHLPRLPTITTRDNVKLGSRNLMKERILSVLKDLKVSRIGVYGLSGVGKTTLASEIVAQVKDDKLFDEVVMVTVSQPVDIEGILDQMADQLGLRFEEKSPIGKASRLRARIKQDNAILIILDDIYEELDLAKLGIPSLDNHKLGISTQDSYKGCKLLLTSRNENILQKNATQENFRLEELNNEESLELFQMTNDVGVELRDIATEVVKSCAGLPVLIVAMAKLLKNKEIHQWKNALDELKRVNSGIVGEKIFPPLKYMYDCLQDDGAKQVFLLCGVYGTSILVGDLLKYVIGLDVFKYIKTIDGVRNKLQTVIDDLKASCFLLHSDAIARVIKMHDLLREVAISIASGDQHVFTMNVPFQDWPGEDFFKRCTWINLYRCCIQTLPEKLDCPSLKFLHLNSKDNPSLEIPNSFFGGMRNLEVLDLTGMMISSLPTSLATLTELKTLCLDQCSLKVMAGIGALKNLEILSFIRSSMEEFPSEIGQLTHLRMLDLSGSGIEVIPPNVVSKLTTLEELYMGNASVKWEAKSPTKQNKNASLAELTHLTGMSTLEIQAETWILLRDIVFEKLERYKIVIGDKWDWRNDNNTLRLLKLKLHTCYQSEHGIKTLMESVEDLYLEEVNGISNVLLQLNGKGFPQLKHLHIQNNGEIQCIINSTGRNQTNIILFPKLETLILHNLSMMKEICDGPLRVDSFRKLRVMKLKSCEQLKYVFLNSMVKNFSQLVEIEVSECHSMENIVSLESINSGMIINKAEFIQLRHLALQYLPAMVSFCCSDIPTSFFDAKVSLSNLETLKLSSINLEKIWDDHQHSTATSFRNLVNLIVKDCGSLKYLFSPFMVENLENLKRLEISKCHAMEEIMAIEVSNNEITLAQDQAGFPKLEEIIINDMKNLKRAWHYQFGRSKTMEVNKCEKLETVFPSGSMLEALRSLETLRVKDCASVEEIFELTTADGMHAQEVTAQLKNLEISGLPEMKRIWSKDPQGLVRFSNLELVDIAGCYKLEYIFPFSIAKDLPQLQHLRLVLCKIKEVVSKKDGSLDETTIFELTHLTSLVLGYLPKLKGFYAGVHTLECQSLVRLQVLDCPHLKVFNPRANRCRQSFADDRFHFSMQQYLFTVNEEVTGNLDSLYLQYWDANVILHHQVPSYRKLKHLWIFAFQDDQASALLRFLKNVPSLERLNVSFSSTKEIFYDELLTHEEERNKINTRLKALRLQRSPKLQNLCREGSQIHPVLEVLEVLMVEECSSLRNLVPSSATFYHLTYLVVIQCNSLKSLMTSSTAGSLFNLQRMKIEECDSLEEIVTEEVDGAKNEIAFNSLLSLELNYLPRLRGFSSSKCPFKFPWLERFVVSQCPQMQIFSDKAISAPKLRTTLAEGESYWEGDLNETIRKMFLNKVAFCSFKHLELSKYPELRGLWYGQVGHEIFSNLKSLVVRNCQWLSSILLSGSMLEALFNLEELEVTECDTLEAVFDLGDMNGRGRMARETIQLKKMRLDSLPKLKRMWKHDSCEIASLGNSSDVCAGECQSSNGEERVDFKSSDHLKLIASNLLTLLYSLEELEVNDCDSLETVFDVKVMDDTEMHVKEESQLKKLTLLGLPNLKHIWNRDLPKILSFKNLQILTIAGCLNLKHVFSVTLCQDLQRLQELSMLHCGIEEIVAIEGEGLDDLEFDFPKLTSFMLCWLSRLKNFYPRRHKLACPSLETLDVCGCEELEIFDFSHLDSQHTSTVDEIDMPIQQPLFSFKVVSPTLKDFALNGKDSMKILDSHHEASLFPGVEVLRLQCFQETPIMWLNRFLEKFPNITTLEVRCSTFKILFPSEEVGYGSSKTPNRLKKLWLFQLEQLEQIGNDYDSLSDVLEVLSVTCCPSLTSLGPPSISFTSLTHLKVEDCKGMTFLMTASTARSLVHLKKWRIINCGMMEEAVMIDEGTPEEITFESLEYFEMTSLPSLKSFCSGKPTLVFLSFELLKVRGCPKMQNFSSGDIIAPPIEIEIENGTTHWTEDVNATIKQLVTGQEVSDFDDSE
ncbi:uncharacterized protein LOC129288205 isoform X2 [Prosopis cineraria]|uniref:uncharacterized protein LOC129288205 isoform X2 n=1 Tax=Prosopis cineraria TaxID=364024 RepID=UPI00240FE02E|nr:uncharacterized protein LOC129288205 isoform X2 [Prosopis cineraria]